MPKKTIKLDSFNGHQYDPEYGTLWSDTWATFKIRRKTIYIGPTLVSKADLDEKIERYSRDIPEWEDETSFPVGNWDFCLPYGDYDDGTPYIAINAQWVTKANIEGAIGWYIRCKYGVTAELRFRWKNHKDKFRLIPC